MLTTLPLDIFDFLFWYFIGFPKKLLTCSRRLIRLADNELSLSLDIKLFFTPLFGDFTFIGRLMGFVFRILRITFSLIVIIPLSVFAVLAPFMWLALPIFLIRQVGYWFFPIFVFIFIARVVLGANIPKKRVYQVSFGNLITSFRPVAARGIDLIRVYKEGGVLRFFKEPEIRDLLKRLELESDDFMKSLSRNVTAENLVRSAYKIAQEQKTRYVEPEHLFLAILDSIPNVNNLLGTYGSNIKYCGGAVSWVISRREKLAKEHFWQDDYEVPPMGGVNRGWTGRITPTLDSVSVDFTDLAIRGRVDEAIGREEEIAQISRILGGTSKENILIIGPPGCGKTTLVKNIALRIIKGTGFNSLKFRRLVSLEPTALFSGTRAVGEVTDKIRKIMDEVEGSGNIILFIDEIHNLLATSSGEGAEVSGVYSAFENRLSSGKTQFIGATNIENYRKYIEPNGAFSRLFHIVELSEQSPENTMKILELMSMDLEKEYGVTITYPALVKNVELSKKLMHERVFPDKAIDILNRTVVSIYERTKILTAEDIAKTISEMTHVPVTKVTESESSKLLNIEDRIKERVIGQDPAIVQLGRALKRARMGIRDEGKPIASFLFVGTTGVGKTETAKALASTYFGDERSMIRLDMSEYQQQDSINKLIGSPDGQQKGFLTEAIRTKPFSLILLDEVEKAYSSILLTFLQVLDDGRLTNSVGRTVDFTNTIIIATSNVGTREIQEVSSRDGSFDEMREKAMAKVREKFAPEFLNRFTGIIVFKPLSERSIRAIAQIKLRKVTRVAESKNVRLLYKGELIDELVKRGYDPEWGARPLERVVEDYVETYLAEKLLEGAIKGGDTVELGKEVFDQEYL